MVDINDFKEEKKCDYKDRTYSVRDNGLVYCHQKEGSRPSPLDNKWTFGKKDEKTGYMMIAGVRVHQIVATAFHGVPEYPTMVVDHIDTNRCNNRPENLRWLTRLENVLNNPYTRSRIAFLCDSIEAFRKILPSLDRQHQNQTRHGCVQYQKKKQQNALSGLTNGTMKIALLPNLHLPQRKGLVIGYTLKNLTTDSDNPGILTGNRENHVNHMYKKEQKMKQEQSVMKKND